MSVIAKGANLDEKTLSLIEYILAKRNGASVTEIMKLCYFLDLACKNTFGEQITDFNYIRYKYGPFDSKVYDYIKSEKVQLVEVEDASKSEYVYEGEDPTGVLKKELTVIDDILLAFKDFTAKELTVFSYDTYPMKNVKAVLGTDSGMMKPLTF